MFGWDHCEYCHDARKQRTEAAADAQRYAEALREAKAEIVRLKIRAGALAEDVAELEARLRLAKSSAISAAETAQAALARLVQVQPIVDAARDWVRPPLSILATRALTAAIEAYEKILAARS